MQKSLKMLRSLLLTSCVIFLLLKGVSVDGKKFLRCELTKKLLEQYKFDKTFISNWICLVEHESQLDTTKITTMPNQSKNYGLFQISSKDYCTIGRAGGICNKKCEDFTDDDIRDDAACAKLIQQRNGFNYWKGWQRYCKDTRNLPNLNLSCKLSGMRRFRYKRNIFFDLIN